MNLRHIKSLISVMHIDLLYIKSYKLLLHKISTNINMNFFLDYYPPFDVRMCESRSHVYIYYRRVRSSIGECFQVGSFFLDSKGYKVISTKTSYKTCSWLSFLIMFCYLFVTHYFIIQVISVYYHFLRYLFYELHSFPRICKTSPTK